MGVSNRAQWSWKRPKRYSWKCLPTFGPVRWKRLYKGDLEERSWTEESELLACHVSLGE
jgi:hypothetical protein